MKKAPNKIISFFSKYSTIVGSIILIPFVTASVIYMVTSMDHHYNYFFEGQEFNIDHETFEITEINKVANVMQASTGFSYQGAACYEDYYVVCCDNFESIVVYDTNTMKVAHIINTGTVNTTWHCNQIFFGNSFYSSRDKFPLLYVSMENEDVCSTMVFRIFKQGDGYYTKLVQELHLVFSKEEDKIYYPNSYYDFDYGLIYYGGYTQKTYMKQDDNLLKYYAFPLPNYQFEYYELNTADSEDTFTLPSETATQGGFIVDRYLYQTFSFGSKTDPLRAPKMRVVNLDKKEIVLNYQNLGEKFGAYEEFEHVVITSSGRMLSLGNPFSIYEFTYKADKKL